MKKFLLAAAILLGSCEGLGIPEEGTIVYDVDFPPADSCEAGGNCDNSSGSGSGGGSGSGVAKSRKILKPIRKITYPIAIANRTLITVPTISPC